MKTKIITALLGAGILMTGCQTGNPTTNPETPGTMTERTITDKTDTAITSEEAMTKASSSGMESMGHEDHNMHATLPEGLKKAENPEFKVGEKVIILADHMPGMKDAKGEIAGAYDTTIYSVTYEPVGGGEKVTDHKWIVTEETENPPAEGWKEGDEVTITADHMKNMKGAKGKIVSVHKGPAYSISYTPTDGGEMVKDHMWVSGDELKAQ